MAQYTQNIQFIDAAALFDQPAVLPILLDTVQKAIALAERKQTAHALWKSRTIVIIDNLSILQWTIPGDATSVVRHLIQWLRALRQLCTATRSALVTLMHTDACAIVSSRGSLDVGDELLFRNIVRSADLWIAVNELPSGRAADCDGEVRNYIRNLPKAFCTTSNATSSSSFFGSC